MNAIRTARSFALVLALSAVAALAAAAPARAAYAAIAYSPSTHSYGYGTNFDTREDAEQEALAQCSGDDARVVGTVHNGWTSLAVGDGGAFSCQYAATAGEARKAALGRCREVTTNSRILVTVSSNGKAQK
jgi:hypothetical protein